MWKMWINFLVHNVKILIVFYYTSRRYILNISRFIFITVRSILFAMTCLFLYLGYKDTVFVSSDLLGTLELSGLSMLEKAKHARTWKEIFWLAFYFQIIVGLYAWVNEEQSLKRPKTFFIVLVCSFLFAVILLCLHRALGATEISGVGDLSTLILYLKTVGKSFTVQLATERNWPVIFLLSVAFQLRIVIYEWANKNDISFRLSNAES